MSKGKQRMAVLILFFASGGQATSSGSLGWQPGLHRLSELLATSSQARDKSGLCPPQSSMPSQSCYCSNGLIFMDPPFQIVPFAPAFPHPIKLWDCSCQMPYLDPPPGALRIPGNYSMFYNNLRKRNHSRDKFPLENSSLLTQPR